MRQAALLSAILLSSLLAGCGRYGFQRGSDEGADAADVVDAGPPVDSRPLGVLWTRMLSSTTAAVRINLGSGDGGGRLLAARFGNALEYESSAGVMSSLTAAANALASTGLLQFDDAGEVTLAKTLTNQNGHCDIRALLKTSEGFALAGITSGTGSNDCTANFNRQGPILMRFSDDGTLLRRTALPTQNGNAQAWSLARYSDGAFAMAAIYGGNVMVERSIPSAGSEATLLTRIGLDGQTTNSVGIVNANEIMPGTMAIEEDDICILGSFNSAATVFGSALVPVGGYDGWVARIGPNNLVRFVRSIGGVSNEPSFGRGAVLADNGGCVVAYGATNPTLPVSIATQQSDGVVLRFDGSGAAIASYAIGSSANDGGFESLVRAGGRLFAGLVLNGPTVIAGTTIAGNNGDVAIVELNDTEVTRVVLVVGGEGTQAAPQLGVIDGNTLGVAVHSTGPVTIGSTELNSDDPFAIYLALAL